MLTFNAVDYQGREGAVWRRIDGVCLSTDTKPTEGIMNGSRLREMDTGLEYLFDEDGGQWRLWTGSGGGGGGGNYTTHAYEMTYEDGTEGTMLNVEVGASESGDDTEDTDGTGGE